MAESAKIQEMDEPTTFVDPTKVQNALQLRQTCSTDESLSLQSNIVQGLSSLMETSHGQRVVFAPTLNFNNKQGDTIHTANVISGSNINVDQSGLSVGETLNGNSKNAADETKDMAKFFPDSIELEPSLFMNYKEKISKYGNVYKGWQVHGKFGKKRIAVKSLEFTEQNKREAKIIVRIPPHPNVVYTLKTGVYKTGPIEHIFIAMELLGPQNLSDFIKNSTKPLSTELRFSLIKQLIKGIAHIHKNNVIHRDIKPDNILVSKDGENLKIIDFGLGKQLRKGRSVTKQTSRRIGTDGWRAPETYNADVISKQADIFSAGLVINFIWTEGEHPFGEDEDTWNYSIKRDQGRDLSKLEGDLKDLVQWMLRFNPRERPSSEQIQEHKWLDGEAVFSLPRQSVASSNTNKEIEKRGKDIERAKLEAENMKREYEKKMNQIESERKRETMKMKSEYEKLKKQVDAGSRCSGQNSSHLRTIHQQPSDGKMTRRKFCKSNAGYEELSTDVFTYSFPAGCLMGVSYEAAEFTEYLPVWSRLAMLHNKLETAFKQGLLFKVQVDIFGRGQIIWNTDIPHITNTNENVDSDYIRRILDALDAKGIRRNEDVDSDHIRRILDTLKAKGIRW